MSCLFYSDIKLFDLRMNVERIPTFDANSQLPDVFSKTFHPEVSGHRRRTIASEPKNELITILIIARGMRSGQMQNRVS